MKQYSLFWPTFIGASLGALCNIAFAGMPVLVAVAFAALVVLMFLAVDLCLNVSVRDR